MCKQHNVEIDICAIHFFSARENKIFWGEGEKWNLHTLNYQFEVKYRGLVSDIDDVV